MSQLHQILVGDCIDMMRTLPDEGVQRAPEVHYGYERVKLSGPKLHKLHPELANEAIQFDSKLGQLRCCDGRLTGSISSLIRQVADAH